MARNMASPQETSSALINEALSRSAKMSKVILDVSRSVKSDSNLDSLWQRLHSGDIDETESVETAVHRRSLFSSPLFSSSQNSLHSSACALDLKLKDSLNMMSCKADTETSRSKLKMSNSVPEDEVNLDACPSFPVNRSPKSDKKSNADADVLRSALIASRSLRRVSEDSISWKTGPLQDDLEALVLNNSFTSLELFGVGLQVWKTNVLFLLLRN